MLERGEGEEGRRRREFNESQSRKKISKKPSYKAEMNHGGVQITNNNSHVREKKGGRALTSKAMIDEMCSIKRGMGKIISPV